ncbi:MBL fold metallo-hydrolase [Indiicoccus explosivorum]|uniref:MBL fold metallo-hydrolase n=1 Tax=Indiicoccus explosivorum TaxID=1917864 RepID=UPI001F4E9076|nr:MBL fold metallo-hydrolase [Indiicoccus explosivorum]
MRKAVIGLVTLLMLPGCTFYEGDTRHNAAGEEAAVLTVHYIDAGQADATLFELGEHAMLIDAGDWNATDVVEYLEAQEIGDIDIAVGTHPDADHIGQLAQVIGQFDVEEVWLPGNTSPSNTFTGVLQSIDASGTGYVEPRAGDEYELGSLEIDVLYPEEITGETNEESISLKLTYGETDFIFTGDAGTEQEQDMIDSGADLDAEVLQLGHHGSNTSTSRAFLRAVSPEVVIYSAGEGNPYGHPHAEVIASAENIGADVYGTDVNGTVIVKTDGETFEVIPSEQGTPTEGENRCMDINIASQAELEQIDGIGEALAEEIMDERPFGSVEELLRIDGIGEGKLAAIEAQGLACVGW